MGDATWSLKAALRRLWADHVIWTRHYVVAAVGMPQTRRRRPPGCSRTRRTSGAPSSPLWGSRRDCPHRPAQAAHPHAVDLIGAAKAGSDGEVQGRGREVDPERGGDRRRFPFPYLKDQDGRVARAYGPLRFGPCQGRTQTGSYPKPSLDRPASQAHAVASPRDQPDTSGKEGDRTAVPGGSDGGRPGEPIHPSGTHRHPTTAT